MPRCEYCGSYNKDFAHTKCNSCGANLPPPGAIEAFWDKLSKQIPIRMESPKDTNFNERNTTWAIKHYLTWLEDTRVLTDQEANIVWTLYCHARRLDEQNGVNFGDDDLRDDRNSLSRALLLPLQNGHGKLKTYVDRIITQDERQGAKSAVEGLFVENGPASRIVKSIMSDFQKSQWRQLV